MAGWLAQDLAASGWLPTLIVPVPLDRVRLHQRGFNQVDLLVESLGRQTSTQVSMDGLRRSRITRSQVGLDYTARQQNVAGAFEADPRAVAGQRVLVVDDLRTTGATLQACASSLHKAGSLRVFGLTLAMAGGRNLDFTLPARTRPPGHRP